MNSLKLLECFGDERKDESKEGKFRVFFFLSGSLKQEMCFLMQFSLFFSLITGLEAQVQDTSKDLYWFWAFFCVDNQTTLVNEHGKRFVCEISGSVKNERKVVIFQCAFLWYIMKN